METNDEVVERLARETAEQVQDYVARLGLADDVDVAVMIVPRSGARRAIATDIDEPVLLGHLEAACERIRGRLAPPTGTN